MAAARYPDFHLLSVSKPGENSGSFRGRRMCVRTRAALPVLTALLLGTVPPGETQDLPAIKPAPVVAGNGSFITTFQTGQQLLVPGVDPILLLPAGDRFLLEA
ncbi:MAG: hypothetical protein DMG23_06680, partial [Acidobacteria bacterium]